MLTEKISLNDCRWVIAIPVLKKFEIEFKRQHSQYRLLSGALLLFLLTFIFPSQLSAQSIHPGQKFSPRQMAELLLFQQRYDEALISFQKILEKGESNGYIIRGLVNAFIGLNRQADGEEYLKEHNKKLPKSSSVLYGLGYLNYLEGRDKEAEEFLIQAVAVDQNNSLALNNLGAVLARKKAFHKAVYFVKRAIEIDPKELMFYRNLQRIYSNMDIKYRFFLDYEMYKKEGPSEIAAGYGKTLARTLRQRGFKLYSIGKLGKAIKSFSELIQIYREINYKEGLVPGLFSLGLLYEERGDLARAQEFFRDVLEINPDHIQARKRIQSGQRENKTTP